MYVCSWGFVFRPQNADVPTWDFWPPDLNQGTSTKALIPSASSVPVSSNWVILLSSRMSSILNSTRTKNRCSSSPGNSGSGMVLGRSWSQITVLAWLLDEAGEFMWEGADWKWNGCGNFRWSQESTPKTSCASWFCPLSFVHGVWPTKHHFESRTSQ